MATPTPTRPAEEVVGAFIPITLGGKNYRLAELPRRTNRDYKDHLQVHVRQAIDDAGPMDTIEQVMDALADSAEVMMDLLILYDQLGAEAWKAVYGEVGGPVLPDREWIDTHATDRECYEAMRKVTGYVFPFGRELTQLLPELRPLILQAVSKGVAAATIAMVSGASMSSARPSTDGSPTTLSDA